MSVTIKDAMVYQRPLTAGEQGFPSLSGRRQENYKRCVQFQTSDGRIFQSEVPIVHRALKEDSLKGRIVNLTGDAETGGIRGEFPAQGLTEKVWSWLSPSAWYNWAFDSAEVAKQRSEEIILDCREVDLAPIAEGRHWVLVAAPVADPWIVAVSQAAALNSQVLGAFFA